ncbi:hypothetical protein C8J57DRAFT_1438159 [Mycena rebaudengoi]|nr:hypothetical protein C8J57DRAFT_1438159 [Mycena rebaudengoi]
MLVWDIQTDAQGTSTASCRVCQDGYTRNPSNCPAHERSAAHKAAAAHRAQQPAAQSTSVPITNEIITDDATRHLLSALTGNAVDPYPVREPGDTASSQSTNHSPPPRPDLGIDWNLIEANDDADIPLTLEQQAVASIARGILERMDDLPMSDEEYEERSDDEDGNGEPNEAVAPEAPRGPDDPANNTQEGQPKKRYIPFWFPWADRITCTLDILMHLPRSVFSHRQLDLFLWLLKVNQVDDVPSVKSMQTMNAALQKMCGIDSIPYDGALGHKYYVNSIAQIIAQEMGNPKVRAHLSFYPEDSGPKLSEARQGQRWLNELADDQTTPMHRISGHDYFIHEPAMLRDGTVCMPIRWFTKAGNAQLDFFAKCWKLEPVSTDIQSGWRVRNTDGYVVPATDFLKNFPDLQRDARLYDLPSPTEILAPWTLTDPKAGNRWRARAEGARVVTFPLWMYCDDTSGNVSKKWNEHNSFLMTPAGLPREESQKEYNIHFLSTSNIAPPLEMLDGVVEQLENAQEQGIWAWDVVLNEPVLVIPEVLALLGDNPMQSEFACHIGLRGKLFCRACWVKGPDALDEPEGPAAQDGNVSEASEAGSVAGSDESDTAAATTTGGKGKGKKRVKETMQQIITRVKAFMTIGRPRNKKETTDKLRSYFTEASTVDTKTKIQHMRTESGIKDTFQQVFLEKLFASYKGKRGRAAKQAALDAKRAELPSITMSPVWRIKGLDPHHDTPVEILHVILLGFVKYLWRDLVQLQLKNKDDKKNLLMTRLSSLDVSGLGISPLAGRTLVQYSGSLTGRDFRAIAQVAPFVVYDLVSSECFETWQALSKLVPLIWQPEIKDIESHISLLTKEIDHFLLCAARWTHRWFNKPKFHLILHLPLHIRRFGPAILFATEAFESFNAIIRAKSVHSNRHAPSRDISKAFAQGNRIRHLLSGGLFLLHSISDMASGDKTTTPGSTFSRNPQDWKSIGAGPKNLVQSRSTVTHYLGLDSKKISTSDRIGETIVVHIEEIIQEIGSMASMISQPDAILVQKATVMRGRPLYGMPAIWMSREWAIFKTADFLCTVNVQHNCIDNKCGPTGTRPIYQEREQVADQTAAKIAHLGRADDLVLNTAQMRDAIHVQRFRIDSPVLDLDEIVHRSAAREVDSQRAAPAQPARRAHSPVPTTSGASTSTHPPPPVRPLPRPVTFLRN